MKFKNGIYFYYYYYDIPFALIKNNHFLETAWRKTFAGKQSFCKCCIV